MRKIASLLVAAVVVSICSVASATPTAYYDPATGSLTIKTDPGVALGVVNFKSAAGTLSAPAANVLPGVNKDTGDLPNFLVLFNAPASEQGGFGHELGNIVTPGTPISDLSLGYFVQFGSGAEQVGNVELRVPEPATLAMAGLGLIGIVAAARRQA